MGLVSRTFSKCTGLLLLLAMLAPTVANAAPKPLAPDAVHKRILKRGLGNWVGVELDTGVVLVGRIVSIDEQSFSMQLHNDPAVTPVQYSEVVDLQAGPSHAAVWAIVGAGVGGMLAIALIAHHEMSNQPKLPNQPTQPVFP